MNKIKYMRTLKLWDWYAMDGRETDNTDIAVIEHGVKKWLRQGNVKPYGYFRVLVWKHRKPILTHKVEWQIIKGMGKNRESS
jgi:hypothetical protein